MEEQQAERIRAGDVSTVSAAREVLQGDSSRRGFSRVLPFMGPAFIASIAYMDPGNFATNIQAGAKYGYSLLWVVLLANLIAMLFQALSAKLHLFFLRETSPGSPGGTAESLDVLSDRLPFLLFYGGESNRGHFQIAVGETMQEPSFEVIPGLDAPGPQMFEPFEGNSLEGPEK